MSLRFGLAVLAVSITALASCNRAETSPPGAKANGQATEFDSNTNGDSGLESAGDLAPVCASTADSGPVQAPVQLMALPGQTGW